MPTQRPLISSSETGVSITRSAPNRFCSPAVARNTPPLTPTSSPNTTALASSRSARARARLTASTSVTSGIGRPTQLVALAAVGARQHSVQVVEHGFGGTQGCRQVALDCRLDLPLAFRGERFLVGFAPRFLAHKIASDAGDRLFLPARLHFLRGAIAPGIVGRRVVAEPVGHALHEARAVAGAGRSDRLFGRRADGENVIAVALFCGKAGGGGLL